jgi:hypothetical protein
MTLKKSRMVGVVYGKHLICRTKPRGSALYAIAAGSIIMFTRQSIIQIVIYDTKFHIDLHFGGTCKKNFTVK